MHKLGPESESGRPSRERLCARESHGPVTCLRLLGTLPSPTMFRFLFARCQAPFCPVGLHLRPDLLFRSLAHRAKTALRPSSLLCSSVSLANRTFPPLRPPNLHVSKRHDVWILVAIGHFNHPPDTHLLKIQDLLGSFRNSTRPQIDSEVRIAVRLAGRHRTARSAPQATGSHDADFAETAKSPPLLISLLRVPPTFYLPR